MYLRYRTMSYTVSRATGLITHDLETFIVPALNHPFANSNLLEHKVILHKTLYCNDCQYEISSFRNITPYSLVNIMIISIIT
jgi:hypothetical protein